MNFLSFLFVLPSLRSEISHSRRAENAKCQNEDFTCRQQSGVSAFYVTFADGTNDL